MVYITAEALKKAAIIDRQQYSINKLYCSVRQKDKQQKDTVMDSKKKAEMISDAVEGHPTAAENTGYDSFSVCCQSKSKAPKTRCFAELSGLC